MIVPPDRATVSPGRWLRFARSPASGAIRPILTNAGSLIATFGVTASLGLAFWWLAARSYSRPTVGVASAAISAMTLLATVATLGLGTVLIGELPLQRRPPRELVSSVAAAVAIVAAGLGLLFALEAPRVSSELAPLKGVGVSVFAAGVALTAAGLVVDAAAIGLLRGGLQLSRNAVFAGGKLSVLALFVVLASHVGGVAIYGAWAAGGALSLLVLLAQTHRRSVQRRDYAPRVAALDGLWRSAAGHQAYNLSLALPSLALPLIVLTLVSAADNAEFYIAFMIASGLYVVPTSLTTVLFAAGTSELHLLALRVRLTFALALGICAAGAVFLCLAAPEILHLFGNKYSNATGTLRILALTSLPLVVKSHFIGVTRVLRRVERSLPLVWAGALAEAGLAAGGASLAGIVGASLGWLAAICLEAAVMGRLVYRVARGTRIPA